MKKYLAAVIVLAASHNLAAAQSGDHAQAMKLWAGPETQCRNCHGAKGEGGFGPDLAGRKIDGGAVHPGRAQALGHHAGLYREPDQRQRAGVADPLFRRDARGRAAGQVALRGARRRAARAGGCAHLRLRPVPRPDPQRAALASRRHRCGLRVVQEHGLRPHHSHAGTREADARTAAGAAAHGQLRADADVGIAAARDL